MPQRNTIRKYFPNGYYHIYNRGVEKRKIFIDTNDFIIFTSILTSYLCPKKPLEERKTTFDKFDPYWRSKLEKDEVSLLCYCLLPNHFHLLLKQNSQTGITKFMRRISNSYVSYFNKKYNRQGTLFQGKFKAAIIKTDEYLLHLSRYIHLNPSELLGTKPLEIYPFSSYLDYIKKRNNSWVNTKFILNFFHKQNDKLNQPETTKGLMTYRNFVELYRKTKDSKIKNLTLEE